MRTFVEIGTANFDTLVALAERGGWRGICVEPVPHLAEELRRLVKCLPVTIVEAAVTDHDGPVPMRYPATARTALEGGGAYVNTENHIGFRNIEQPDHAHVTPSDLQDVEGMTLDTLLDRYDVSTIDLLKIDVEGHELNILRPYSWRVRPVFIKAEHQWIPCGGLHHFLRVHGYLVWSESWDLYAIDAAPKEST